MRRFLLIASLCVAALGFAVVALLLGLTATGATGRSFLVDAINRAASTPERGIEIGALDEPLSSHPVARDIALSDRDGVYLKIDRVDLEWSPLALLALRLDIERLALHRLDLLRRPAPTKAAPTAGGGGTPDLPLRIRLGALDAQTIALAEPALGVAAQWSLGGAATLGPIADGAKANMTLRRLDAPGEIALRLDAAPGGRLTLAFAANEPAGGLIARLAALPGLPAVDATIDGAGSFDDFNAKLAIAAGEALDAKGVAAIKRAGAARRIAFDLSGEIAPLLPKALAPLFDGAAQLSGAATLNDDGAATLERAALRASALTLDAEGRIDAARKINARLRLSGGDAPEARVRARLLEGEADIVGALDQPTARAHLRIEDARAPAGQFGRVEFNAKLVPANDASARFDIDARADGDELAFYDLKLAEAVGPQASFALKARINAQGDADVGVAHLSARVGEIDFSGRAGPSALDAKLVAAIPDLARLSALAGRRLAGALKFSADLSGAPQAETIAARLAGEIAGPAFDNAALDGAIGRRLTLAGKIETLAGGGARFENLALAGDHLRALLQGAATRDASDARAQIDLADLKALDSRLAGRASLSATLTGGLDAPALDFEALLDKATAAGRAVPHLALQGKARDLRAAPQLDATLAGSVEGKAATGVVKAARAGAGWRVDALRFRLGKVALDAEARIDAQQLATGRLTLRAPDLDEISVFALQKLAGALSADVAFDGKDGAQNVALAADARGLRADKIALDRFAANLKGRDLFRRPALDGEATLDSLRIGGETVSKARIVAKPAGAATALEASADARGFSLAARANLTPGERQRLDLSALTLARDGRKITLAAPATITLNAGSVDIKNLSLALGAGRLDIDGAAGERLDLSVKAKALPLAYAAMADASLNYDGTLDAEAKLTGAKNAPAGEWSLRGTRLTAPQLRANGLPAVELTARGRLSGGRTTLDAEMALGNSSRMKISGAAPLDANGALDLSIAGALDAALANTALADGGQTLRGKADIDLRLTGKAASPIVGGGVTLRDGAFADPLNGVYLDQIGARLEGRGQQLTIANFSATTKNGGRISALGHVTIAPDAGFPGELRLAARNAQLASTDVVTSAADIDLAVSGPLARAPKVAGRVTLTNMEVTIPDRIPGGLKPLPDAVHIDAKGFAKEMLALEAKQKAKAAKKSNFDAAIDLSISAPNRVFVRGHGVDAEFGGDLRLTGTIQKPTAIGAFELRRGKLLMLTQRIEMSRGKLSFSGGLTPELDFTAETQAADVTARISVTGPATLPVFAFSSTPEMPQDEVLSRLLFAKASGSLSPFQAVQLATALAQFSGAATGVDAFEKMRKALGVDSLDLDAGGKNGAGPTIGASRYLTDNISVGVRTGAKPEQSAVNVGVDVTKKLRVQGETSMDGKTSVGVGVEWEY